MSNQPKMTTKETQSFTRHTKHEPDRTEVVIESSLDPKVKDALRVMAVQIRNRAMERSHALEHDIASLIAEFVKGYDELHGDRCYRLEAINGCWTDKIQSLCKCLGEHVGDVDVERHMKTLSNKILELDEEGYK